MRRRMRNFDPMQGAGEECGTREKMREARVRMTMVGRGRHELAAHHRRLHTVLLVSGPRIPLLHSASVCCWCPVPAFLSCILHRVESPNSSLFSHTADRCSWTATIQSPN